MNNPQSNADDGSALPSSSPLASSPPSRNPPLTGGASPLDINNAGKRRRRPNNPATAAVPSSPMTPPAKRDPNHPRAYPPAADMSVLLVRVDLYDSEYSGNPSLQQQQQQQPLPGHLCPAVAPYHFEGGSSSSDHEANDSMVSACGGVAVCRVPPAQPLPPNPAWTQFPVVDKTSPCPFANDDLTKYWKQRRRLFSRFDRGIQLDDEGWFSVTPEQIADHVARRLLDLSGVSQSGPNNVVVLDAFCGCGGNSIAFARAGATVIGVDVDRSKLQRAANNAAIYDVPKDKLILIECNALFILEFCFKNGDFSLDQPISGPAEVAAMMAAMPPPVPTETCHGYTIGGIDMLPRQIHAVFMDPPWGGVDYSVFGKTGYDLQRHMRIQRPVSAAPQGATQQGNFDDFFDSFQTQPRSKQERKDQFNIGLDESNCVNGSQLLALAAAATARHQVLFDVPRNTNRVSLGQSALAAGYRGNCKLEEYYLNGRLKTVTAYFGHDWSNLVPTSVTTTPAAATDASPSY